MDTVYITPTVKQEQMWLLPTFRPPRRVAVVTARAYHHGNLRRALLDAALARFAAGDVDFTLRELARDTGVTHNAPYRHFAGKPELLEALRAEGFERLAETCREALARAGEPPRERVRALGEAYVRFAIASPHHFRLILGAPAPGPLGGERARDEAEGASFALLEATLRDGQAAGVIRDDLSPRDLALAAWALVHGLASLVVGGQVPGSDPKLRRWVKLLDATFFDGVAKQPRRPR